VIFESASACGGEGEYYSNARWYDPTLGRFLTEDPVRDGINWFAYVNNNPLAYTDPTGLDPWTSSNYKKDPSGGLNSPATISAVTPAPGYGLLKAAAGYINFGLTGKLITALSGKRLEASVYGGFSLQPEFPGVVRDARITMFGVAASVGVGGVEALAPAATSPDLISVVHFTSAEGASAIEASGTLRAGSFVAMPNEVAGLGTSEVETMLEIQAGRGALSATLKTPSSNLAVPFNGPTTSGEATQFQLLNPIPVKPGSFVPTEKVGQ